MPITDIFSFLKKPLPGHCENSGLSFALNIYWLSDKEEEDRVGLMVCTVVVRGASSGTRVLKLDRDYPHLDLGSLERYWGAVDLSHRHSAEGLTVDG
jgi:hypothetical protein